MALVKSLPHACQTTLPEPLIDARLLPPPRMSFNMEQRWPFLISIELFGTQWLMLSGQGVLIPSP